MIETMIPKVIHYCWFGRNPLPESTQKCIASWRKYLPDYEIKEWNEDNFDVNIIPYTKEAYEAKKYAFVSDYARFWILYKYGGLYFDTDVEVIKPMDEIVNRGAFMGVESDGKKKGQALAINPGLGLGAIPGMEIYQRIIDGFHRMDFYGQDGAINPYTMIPMVTELFKSLGFKGKGSMEYVAETYIYPQEFFNPFDDMTGKLNITPYTYSIHWYSKTWVNKSVWKIWASRVLHRVFGLSLHNMKKSVEKLFKRNAEL